MAFSQTTLAQTDTAKNNSPLTFECIYTSDIINNISGGIKHGSAYLGMANIKIQINTENADLWKNGQLFINAANTHGSTPSENLIGDFQTVSNLEAGNLTYMHEIYYKQTLGKLTTIIGLQDLCAEFVSSENAALYLNSSFGVPSTISSNLPVPIFPLTSIGMQFQYQFSEKIIAKFALFDGLPDDFDINPHNLSWRLSGDDGFLAFSELNLQNLFKTNANYKIGYYYHNSHKVAISNENKTISMPANYGLYLIADQQIFERSNGKKLSTFTQLSISPSAINENYYYIGIGLNYQGLFNKRKEDILGLALAHSGFNNLINKYETAIELTYKAQMGKYIFLQPDLQYIINPSGTSVKTNNAILANFRFGIRFGS